MSALTAAALHVARPVIADWAEDACRALAEESRPLGQPRAVADGPAADRILLIGGGAAVGRGATSHDLSLPGALARALRARTGRGAVVDVLVDPLLTVAGLAGVLGTAELDRYDAVVTTVGDIDALRGIAPVEWRDRVRTVLSVWQRRVTDGRVLLMVAIPGMRDEPAVGLTHGRVVDAFTPGLNAITEREVDGLPSVYTTLLPTPERHAGRVTLESIDLWGRQLAAELIPHLPARLSLGETARDPAQRLTSGVDDAERIAALLEDRAPSLERIVAMAAAALNTPTAVVTVLGPETQWHVSRFGLDLESVPIEQSFCAVAVRSDCGMVVPDAPYDPRFAHNPLVTETGLRYYAGVPIEDAAGRRIGALCVIDTKPRNRTSAADLAVLRRLADTVEEVLRAHPDALAAPTPREPPMPVEVSAVVG